MARSLMGLALAQEQRRLRLMSDNYSDSIVSLSQADFDLLDKMDSRLLAIEELLEKILARMPERTADRDDDGKGSV